MVPPECIIKIKPGLLSVFANYTYESDLHTHGYGLKLFFILVCTCWLYLFPILILVHSLTGQDDTRLMAGSVADLVGWLVG